MFSDKGKSSSGLNSENGENDSTGSIDSMFVVNHAPPIRFQRSSNLKISHLAYWSAYLAYQIFIFCQQSILSNRFATLFHSQPFNEMFIFSSKFRWRSGTFTNLFLYCC